MESPFITGYAAPASTCDVYLPALCGGSLFALCLGGSCPYGPGGPCGPGGLGGLGDAGPGVTVVLAPRPRLAATVSMKLLPARNEWLSAPAHRADTALLSLYMVD
jgi:hypothetical protein